MSFWRGFRPFASLVLSVGIANGLHAAEIKIRAGEHPGFSRLVFDISTGTKWRLNKLNNGYVVTLDGDIAKAAGGDVFKFIPKTRIQSVNDVSDENQTQINVVKDCVCHAVAFQTKQGRLVVDIKDGLNADEPLEVGSLPTAKAVPESQVVMRTALDIPAQSVVLQPPDVRPERKANVAIPLDHTAAKIPPPLAVSPVILFQPTDQRIIESQSKLVRSLGRAMTQGVIQPAEGVSPGDISEKHTTQIETKPQPFVGTDGTDALHAAENERPKVPLEKTAPSPMDHVNLNAQSVLDRDKEMKKGDAGQPLETLLSDCIKPDALDVPFWAGTDPVSEQIATLRSAITGEFDKADPAALNRLVRLYAYHGFSAEVSALTGTYPHLVQDADLVLEISNLIETGAAIDGSVLAGQVGCPAPASMWGLMANASPSIAASVNPDAIVLYFTQMPIDLRRRIGPTIATRYLDAGLEAQAVEIAGLIRRASGDHGPDFALLEAKLALKAGVSQRARAILLGLVASNQRNAPEALIILMTSYLSASEQIPIDLVTETASRAFELRGTAIGNALRLIEIEARAKALDHLGAFLSLDRNFKSGALALSTKNAIANRLFLALSPKEIGIETVMALSFMFHRDLVETVQTDPARRHLAQIFLTAGLPGQAVELLRPLQARATRGDQMLTAQSYYAAGQTNQALKILERLDADDVQNLRAEILGSVDRRSDALTALPASADHKIKQELSWQAGRLDLIDESVAGSRKVAADYMTGAHGHEDAEKGDDPAARAFETKLTTPDVPSLKGMDALLSASRDSRVFLDRLLAEHPMPANTATE